MKRLTAVALAASFAGCALAQSDFDLSNIGLRLGFVYPFDSGTRNITRNMLGVGIDIANSTTLFKNGESHISIDWYTKSTNGSKGSIIPLMFNQRFFGSQTSAEDSYRFYWTLGVGASLVDVTTSKIVPTGKAGIGTNFGERAYFEANWLFSSDANGARADSIGFFVGIRF